jgi:hypothetical protein
MFCGGKGVISSPRSVVLIRYPTEVNGQHCSYTFGPTY